MTGVSGMIGMALSSFFFLTFLAGTALLFLLRLLDLRREPRRPLRRRPRFRAEDFRRDLRGFAAGADAGAAGRIIRIEPLGWASPGGASSPTGPPPPIGPPPPGTWAATVPTRKIPAAAKKSNRLIN